MGEALAHTEEGVRLAELADQPFSLIYAYSSLGSAHLWRGDFEAAIPLFERAIRVNEVSPTPLLAFVPTAMLGYAQALAGRREEAIPRLEQAAASLRGQPRDATTVHWIAYGLLLAGEIEEAARRSEWFLQLARDHNLRGGAAWAQFVRASILARRDDPEAEQAFRLARAQALELGMRPLVAHCHLGLSRLSWDHGQPEQAREQRATAAALYRAMGMQYWLVEAEKIVDRP